MATPCEEKGYKVGDFFRVKKGCTVFEEGSIIKLDVDDGTKVQRFELINGEPTEYVDREEGTAYTGLANVTPINEEPAKLDTRSYSPDNISAAIDNLIGAFIFDSTPQGITYWTEVIVNLSDLLDKIKENTHDSI